MDVVGCEAQRPWIATAMGPVPALVVDGEAPVICGRARAQPHRLHVPRTCAASPMTCATKRRASTRVLVVGRGGLWLCVPSIHLLSPRTVCATANPLLSPMPCPTAPRGGSRPATAASVRFGRAKAGESPEARVRTPELSMY